MKTPGCPFSHINNHATPQKLSETESNKTYTSREVLRILEDTQKNFINERLQPQQDRYHAALRDFLDRVFQELVQRTHYQIHQELIQASGIFSVCTRVITDMQHWIFPGYLKLALKSSMSIEDWKSLMRNEFPVEGKNLILAAEDMDLPYESLATTLQGGWSNAVETMVDIYVRAEQVSNGSHEQYDAYCLQAEKFLLRMSATSLSVHSHLIANQKRIIHEGTEMSEKEVKELVVSFYNAALSVHPELRAAPNVHQVNAFVSLPRKGCPALHVKDPEGVSYILIFFRLFGELYKTRYLAPMD